MSDSSPAPDPAACYDARAAHHATARDAVRARVRGLSAARLLVAVGVLVALVVRERPGAPPGRGVATIAALLGAAAFVALVVAHRRGRARERAHAVRLAVATRGAARVRRAWAELPEPAWALPGADRPARVDDLHLLGRASVAQLLDVVTPALGGPRLLAWLLADPPAAAELRARQTAVRALAARPALLGDCAAAALEARALSPRVLERFVGWAEATDAVTTRAALGRTLLRTLAIVGPLLTVVAIGVGATDRVPFELAFGPAIVVNVAAAALAQRRLAALLAGVADLPVLLGALVALLARVADEPVAEAERWETVRERARRDGGPAAVRRLARWLAWAEVRYTPMVHWALNALVAYDAWIVAGLDGWRRGAGRAARGWFDALADAEALLALATLAHDHPAWAFAAFDEAPDAPGLDATALAHPLLPGAARVGNPVRLGGPGSLLVVTGSNMAGKTTLLRAIGVNVLLAQAGGPACAASLRLRRLRVRTSVRVQDALDAGVSLFLAELRQLRAIVDVAETPADGDPAPGQPTPVLYLLDEVLHGTNSRDRRTATRAILARLAGGGGIGVVTTHDLELADEPALAPATTHVHFREGYATGSDGPRMTFDYVARPGKAVTTNALALLTVLGLGPPASDPVGPGTGTPR